MLKMFRDIIDYFKQICMNMLTSVNNIKLMATEHLNAIEIRLNMLNQHLNVDLALYKLNDGAYTEAESRYKAFLQFTENNSEQDFDGLTRCIVALGELYTKTGRFSEAEAFYKRALEIDEKTFNSDYLRPVICFSGLGDIYTKTGRFTEAEAFYQRALAIEEKTFGKVNIQNVSLLNNFALLYQTTGRFAEAGAFYQRALRIDTPKNLRASFRKVRDGATQESNDSIASRYDKLILHNNIVSFFRETGENDDIEKHCEWLLEYAEELYPGKYSCFVEILNNLVGIIIIKTLGRESLLLNSAKKAYGHEHPELSIVLNNLALISIDSKRYAYAGELVARAQAIIERSLGSDYWFNGTLNNTLATLYRSTCKDSEAERCYHLALAIREKAFGPDHPDVASSLNGLALLYSETNRSSASTLLRKRAVNILQNVRQDVSRLGKEALASYDSTISDAYAQLSEALIEAGKYGEAEYVMGMLKEKERFELLRRDNAPASTARSISYSETEAPLVAQMLEFGNSLSSLGKQQEVLKQIKQRTSDVEQKLKSIKDQLINLNQEYASFLDTLNDSLGPATTKAIDQDSNLMIDIAELGADTAAIVTVSGAEKLHTIFVTSHGRKAFPSQISAKDLGSKIITFRELLKNPDTDEFMPLAQELYQHIISPLEEELKVGGYTTILWMLDGALRLLPLAALHDGTQFLAERLQNVCITTKSKIGSQRHEQWNGLGMGASRGYEGHEALPSVKEELDAIIRDNGKGNTTGILPGEILLDDEFTRQAMESRLEEGFKAVHFASHFELNPFNETLSYLLLGDGSKIRMDELRCLPTLFKGVDLVAFSACSTGLGTASTRGREVDGIGYLGEMQGAKTVLATLWPVEDNSTSMLMREFYRLREEGMTKAKALQKAQLALLNKKDGFISENPEFDFSHPYFWAPFILIGNGG